MAERSCLSGRGAHPLAVELNVAWRPSAADSRGAYVVWRRGDGAPPASRRGAPARGSGTSRAVRPDQVGFGALGACGLGFSDGSEVDDIPDARRSKSNDDFQQLDTDATVPSAEEELDYVDKVPDLKDKSEDAA